jgi:hypothetical protein
VATEALGGAPPAVAHLADDFVARVDALEHRLHERGASLSDVLVSPALRHGARFVLREAFVVGCALPIALLGRLVHWLPLRMARSLAMRSLVQDPSRDQPAMRTIVLGLALVSLWYVLLAAVVAYWLGAVAAVVWIAMVFVSARVDFLLSDRVRRAWRRARTYLALRGDPALRSQSLADIDLLVTEALALETALSGGLAGARERDR